MFYYVIYYPLQVSFNSLTSLLAIDFRAFTQLDIFDASNNKLRCLGNLAEAAKLADVLLSNNDLGDIPLEFGRLKHIRNISIMGNPQKTIRLNIVQQGTEGIMKALRMKLPDEDSPTSASAPAPASAPAASTSATRAQQAQPGVSRGAPVSGRRDQAPPAPAPAAAAARGARGEVWEESNAFSPPPPMQIQHHHGTSSSNTSASTSNGTMVSMREAVSRPMQQPDPYAYAPATGSSSSSSSSSRQAAPSDSLEIDQKISSLDCEFQELSASLDDPGLSEAKRFALKKNLAKLRANILRLNREKDSAATARR
jgi:hypothetical protein